MRRRAVHSWLLVVAIFASLGAYSQADYWSPYSRFGIGDLSQNIHPQQLGMGGLSVALRESNLINYRNPAAYTAYDSMSFVFDGSVRERISNWETLNKTHQSEFSSLGHIAMGFPVTQWLKVTTGLRPVSDVGYEISDLRTDPDLGSIEYLYQGEGGISDFFIGAGLKISERLSVGANASYVWGDIDLQKFTTFPDSIYYWSAKVSNRRQISDIRFSYGLQYIQPLNENWRAIFGATYSNATDLSATEQMISTQVLRSGTGIESVNDTIINDPNNKGQFSMPSSFGTGLMIEKNNNLRFGIDYRWDQWEDFRAFGASDSLKNSNYLAVGAEILPNHNVLSSYLKKIKYRFGFHYANTNLQLNNTQLSEIGIAFGLGLPIKSSGSSINIGAEIGRRGTTDNDLIKENYVKFTLGISIFERWFIKRKYQ